MHPSSCRISSTNRMTTTSCTENMWAKLLRLLKCCSNVAWAKKHVQRAERQFLKKNTCHLVNQHGNGTKTLSGMYFQLKVELPLPSCFIRLYFAKGWKSWTYYSFYSRLLFFFVTPFFPKTNSDSTNSLWTFESRNANCTPCCVTMSKSLWIVPLVPLAAEGVARTGVGTVGFTVPEDVSLDWRRTGVRGRGAKAMGGRGQTSHQSWMAEDLSIQKSSCCRFVVFFQTYAGNSVILTSVYVIASWYYRYNCQHTHHTV